MQPTLLLDCDGVLADFLSAALNVVHDLNGVRYTHDQVRTWEIFESIGDVQLREQTYARMNEPGFCEKHIDPYPGAVEAVRDLRKHAEVFIVTAPFHEAVWMHDRLTWLLNHFDIPRTHVLFAHHKHIVRGDVFVDDNPGHVRRWNESKHGGKGLLWDRHYNREVTDLPRICSWDEVRAALSA